MLEQKTLLVTGAAGFIGSTFVAQSLTRGERVIVLDALTYAGHRENLDWIEKKDNLELVVGNICDAGLVSGLLKKHDIDAVINFAAESHVDNSISGSSIFIETNINGVYNLLEQARKYWQNLSGGKKDNFRYVQISTDEVYGSLGARGKFTETTAMAPSSPYSASKAAGDHLTHAWFKTYGLPTIITNCTNNYGPRQFPEKLIPRMITEALAERPLPIYGNGKNIRDWIHVEDHCNGIYLALTRGNPGETYAFGGDAELNNIEVVDAICDILDDIKLRADGKSYKEQKIFVEDRPGHDLRYAIDDSKACAKLGFERKYTEFSKGLRATIDWYLQNGKWCEKVTAKKKAA